jgi:hypothetical protein
MESHFPLVMKFDEEEEESPFWSSSNLNLIDLKYIQSIQELKGVFSSLQCLRRKPKLIIIEDLSLVLNSKLFYSTII